VMPPRHRTGVRHAADPHFTGQRYRHTIFQRTWAVLSAGDRASRCARVTNHVVGKQRQRGRNGPECLAVGRALPSRAVATSRTFAIMSAGPQGTHASRMWAADPEQDALRAFSS
jgi:hypothetical protein